MSKSNSDLVVIRTRLHERDILRFRQCATTRGVNEAALARTAILFYLASHEAGEVAKQESIYAQQLKNSTNRICAMLSKIAMDARAMYFYVGQEDPESIRACRERAGQVIAKAFGSEDHVTQVLAQHITKDPPCEA